MSTYAVLRGRAHSDTSRQCRLPGAAAPTAYRVRMDDAQIHDTIEKLVAEEHELWNRQGAGAATDGDRRRLE